MDIIKTTKKKFKIIGCVIAALLLSFIGMGALSTSASGKGYMIGTSNLNNTENNSAQLGSKLESPEKGWARVKYDNKNIEYGRVKYNNKNIEYGREEWRYDGDNTKSYFGNWSDDSSYVKFNFTGDKIRIISNTWWSGSGKVNVTIDGKDEGSFSCQGGNAANPIVLYEKTGLESKEHSIVIQGTKTGQYNYIFIKGFDIDENSEIKPYGEVSKDIEATSISLDKTSMNLLEGSSEKLTATVLPDNATNKKVIWTSSNNDIATVDENGNVTAAKEGQATIMAKVEGTELTATCVVNVTKPQVPEETGNAILSISLVNGSTKEYDVSMEEVNKFIQWYETRTKGEGSNIYAFSKKGSPYKEIKEYIAQDKIASFEIKEYVSSN
ncbi:Ig-like domain-containing protein [Clostridium sp. CTA-7]